MAKKTRDTFKLGLAVLIMAALLLVLVISISSGTFSTAKREILVLRFSAGNPLPPIAKGSPVLYLGQKIGSVIDAEIIDTRENSSNFSPPYLKVHASVREGLSLRTDGRYIASNPPLGGKGAIEVIHPGKTGDVISESSVVYGSVSGLDSVISRISSEVDPENADGLLYAVKYELNAKERDSLLAKIHTSVSDLNDITEVLATELDRTAHQTVLAKLHNAMDQLNTLAEGLASELDRTDNAAAIARLDQALDRLNEVLEETAELMKENHPIINHAVASLDNALTTFDERVADVLARELELGDEQPDRSILAKVHTSIDKLEASLTNIETLSDDASGMVSKNRDRVDEFVENLTEASEHTKQAIKDLKRHPWKLLFKPNENERRELNILEAAREFSDAAASLDDASMRMRALMEREGENLPPDDPDLLRLRDELAESIERLRKAEQGLIRALTSESR